MTKRAWRREAEYHNRIARENGDSSGHQGRRNKRADIKLPKFMLMPELTRNLLARAGMMSVPEQPNIHKPVDVAAETEQVEGDQ